MEKIGPDWENQGSNGKYRAQMGKKGMIGKKVPDWEIQGSNWKIRAQIGKIGLD